MHDKNIFKVMIIMQIQNQL